MLEKPSRTVYAWSQYGHFSSGAVWRLRLVVSLPEAVALVSPSPPARRFVSRASESTAADALQRAARRLSSAAHAAELALSCRLLFNA